MKRNRVVCGAAIALLMCCPAFAGKFTARWTLPTHNTDGSPLTDLANLRITWGTCVGTGTNAQVSKKLGSTLLSPSATSTTVTTSGANPVCLYLTSINKAGVESVPSNVAVKFLTNPGSPIVLPGHK